MNLLRPLVAFSLPCIVTLSAYAANLALYKTDFSTAKESKQNSEILVMAELSPIGVSKMKALNQEVGHDVDVKIGGEIHTFKLRRPIEGKQLQMGPFSLEAAKRVVEEINSQK